MAIFRGAGVAIVTPFNEDGSVNFDNYGELIEWQIAEGTDAIISCGTTGEASTMTDEEQIEVISYCVDKVKGRVPVIAGAGSNDTKHGVNLSVEAEKAGADALLQVTPYYNKATQKGLIQHYNAIADSVNIPIILYSVQGRTGVNIKPSTVVELAKHPNITAIKEASGNISQCAEIARLVPEDFSIYSGNDDMITPLLALGGDGVISVLSNIAPRQTHEIVQKFFDGDIAGAISGQLKAKPMIDALFAEVNPIPVKAAMNEMGFDVGDCRLPLTTMSEAALNQLREVLKKYQLI